MSETTWQLGATDGSVTVYTDVTGPAARTGHRLTIEMTQWSAQVTWAGEEPATVSASIAVDSLQVRAGAGGVTPMSGPERSVARANALKSLKADKFREITYESGSITRSDGGYRVDGTVTIHGRRRECALDLAVDGSPGRWRICTETTLSQSDFGIKPYSLMMGALKVADEVRLGIEISPTRDG
ncbi:YceI family protein [Gordonia sp. DT30]|uniref:YceI family protein n=1 Tax=unclassified Gordonia (in: high G+C Gram-positive bacteria) TaxID=2657482 RepID=UPI003CEE63AB